MKPAQPNLRVWGWETRNLCKFALSPLGLSRKRARGAIIALRAMPH
jgi:hypothetical protein